MGNNYKNWFVVLTVLRRLWCDGCNFVLPFCRHVALRIVFVVLIASVHRVDALVLSQVKWNWTYKTVSFISLITVILTGYGPRIRRIPAVDRTELFLLSETVSVRAAWQRSVGAAAIFKTKDRNVFVSNKRTCKENQTSVLPWRTLRNIECRDSGQITTQVGRHEWKAPSISARSVGGDRPRIWRRNGRSTMEAW